MIFKAKNYEIGAGQEPASDYEALGRCCKGSRVNKRSRSQNHGKPSLDFLRAPAAAAGRCLEPRCCLVLLHALRQPCQQQPSWAALQLLRQAAAALACSKTHLRKEPGTQAVTKGKGIRFLLLGGFGVFKILFSGKTFMID